MQAARDSLVADLQDHLHQADHARAVFEVPDVGLDAAEIAGVGRLLPGRGIGVEELLRDRFQAADLDRIAQRRTRAVALDVADAAEVDTRIGHRTPDHRRLRVGVRRRERGRAPAVVFGRALDHRIDVVASASRGPERLEHQHADALAPHVSVRLVGERLAAAVLAQHAGLGEAHVHVGGQQRVDAADDGRVAMARTDRLDRSMHRDQRAAAGGVDRVAGAVPVHVVTDAVRADRGHVARHRIRLDRHVAHQARVAARTAADEDPGVGALQAIAAVSRILDALPDRLHHQPLFRAHVRRLGRRDAEEQRIELVDAVDEGAPLAHAGIVPPVPALGRDLADHVALALQHPPELVGRVRTRDPATHADHGDVFVAIAGAVPVGLAELTRELRDRGLAGGGDGLTRHRLRRGDRRRRRAQRQFPRHLLGMVLG